MCRALGIVDHDAETKGVYATEKQIRAIAVAIVGSCGGFIDKRFEYNCRRGVTRLRITSPFYRVPQRRDMAVNQR